MVYGKYSVSQPIYPELICVRKAFLVGLSAGGAYPWGLIWCVEQFNEKKIQSSLQAVVFLSFSTVPCKIDIGSKAPPCLEILKLNEVDPQPVFIKFWACLCISATSKSISRLCAKPNIFGVGCTKCILGLICDVTYGIHQFPTKQIKLPCELWYFVCRKLQHPTPLRFLPWLSITITAFGPY